MRFLLLFPFLFVGCTINVPESKIGTDESEVDSGSGTDTSTKTPKRPTTPEEKTNPGVDDRDDDTKVAPSTPTSYGTVCPSMMPAGMMDVAIQKDGHFYETAGRIILEARTKLSSDEDTAQRLMYGPEMRMWVHVPELIRTVKGRGSPETELCLTIGNVNCRYIWGAKVFELDACDFGVQPEDVLGARFFSLEVHNSDLAPDAQVRAELKAVSPVR